MITTHSARICWSTWHYSTLISVIQTSCRPLANQAEILQNISTLTLIADISTRIPLSYKIIGSTRLNRRFQHAGSFDIYSASAKLLSINKTPTSMVLQMRGKWKPGYCGVAPCAPDFTDWPDLTFTHSWSKWLWVTFLWHLWGSRIQGAVKKWDDHLTYCVAFNRCTLTSMQAGKRLYMYNVHGCSPSIWDSCGNNFELKSELVNLFPTDLHLSATR